MTTIRLPEKLSDLILLALRDLEACEQDPKYQVRMETWHTPMGKGCAVCLAGSIMAQTLGISRFDQVSAFDIEDEHNERRLLALNGVRLGIVDRALETLGQLTPSGPIDELTTWDITPYRESPAMFKQNLRQLVGELQANGY